VSGSDVPAHPVLKPWDVKQRGRALFRRSARKLTAPAFSFMRMLVRQAGSYCHLKKRTARKPKTAAHPAMTRSDVADGKVPCIEA
jgi:hypothetical protein